jgi:exopolysaccharide biosynthesis WecB/TagA/CpsF family protein
MEKICEIAAEQGKSVYLVGGKEGIAKKAAEKLKKKYHGLRVVGAEKGIIFKRFFGLRPQNDSCEYLVSLDFNIEENNKLLERIRAVAPDILFVAFGHGKQEKWLAEFLLQLPSVKIGMGVGGAFDYISGQVRRAPKFARYLGLEWLCRLLSQPWRIKRIWKAIVSFGLLVKDYKIQIALPYRQGVIGFIINQEGKFFIAKRCPQLSDSYFFHIDHWQPPQGGISAGETAEQAILKEVREETGMTVEIVARCSSVYKYDWSVSFMKKKGRGYHFRGQQKSVFLLKYSGDGNDIKVDGVELCDYRWVDLEELKKIIHPMRRPSLEILLAEVNNFRVV